MHKINKTQTKQYEKIPILGTHLRLNIEITIT